MKLSIVHCPPVTMAIIKRPDPKYQLGFSVDDGIVSHFAIFLISSSIQLFVALFCGAVDDWEQIKHLLFPLQFLLFLGNLTTFLKCLQICSLMRGGIAERGGIRVGHRIIEINGQSVVATSHDKIIQILTNAVGEVSVH